MQLVAAFVFFTLTLTFPSPAVSFDACSTISNTDCNCTHSSASSALPDITCRFQSASIAPLIANVSADEQAALGTLDLSDNDLVDLPEDFFGSFITIDTVLLRNNSLTSFPQAILKLAGVRSVDLSDNKVNKISVELLAGVKGLEDLNQSGNKMQILSHDGEDKNLQEESALMLLSLNLSRNEISSIDGNMFKRMSHLTTLDLSHNQLQEVTSTMFSQLEPSLVTLDLSHNALQLIQPLALQHLGHLRVLSLAHNPLLSSMDDLQFPDHLRSVDLSHCALTIIDHCHLASLADLSFIGLSGNELTCTCQLYLLLQWYQNQHHTISSMGTTPPDNSWTCLNASSPPTSHNSTHGIDPRLTYVANLTQCQDSDNHCLTLEHAEHHKKGSGEMVVTLQVASSSGTLMASWSFQENGEVVVDGFRLNYIPEDGGPIVSEVIPADQRSYSMHISELEMHFMVCLDVLAYETAVIHQECRSFKDESGNIVVGILAGIVFLVPCIVAMVYVFCKDRRIQNKYTKVDEEAAVAEQECEGGDKCFFHVNCHAKLKHACLAENDAEGKETKEPESPFPMVNGQSRADEDQKAASKVVARNEAPEITTPNQATEVVTAVEVAGTNTSKADTHDGQHASPMAVNCNQSPAFRLDAQKKNETEEKEAAEFEVKDSQEPVFEPKALSDGNKNKSAEVKLSSSPDKSQGVENPGYLNSADDNTCMPNPANDSTKF